MSGFKAFYISLCDVRVINDYDLILPQSCLNKPFLCSVRKMYPRPCPICGMPMETRNRFRKHLKEIHDLAGRKNVLRTKNNETGWRDQVLSPLAQESVESIRSSEVPSSNQSVVKLETPEGATPTALAIECSERSTGPTLQQVTDQHPDIFTVILDRVGQLLGSGAAQSAFDNLTFELSSEYPTVGLGVLTGAVGMARGSYVFCVR